MKFVVDQMLGTLAKWLRVMGYDAVYDTRLDDPDLVRLARAENRVLLTRDTGIARRKGVPVLLIASDYPEEQLAQVIHDCGLRPGSEPNPRCLRCNAALQSVSRESIYGQVPAYVWHTHQDFRRCPACGRLYWRGTHWQNMRARIARLIAQAGGDLSP